MEAAQGLMTEIFSAWACFSATHAVLRVRRCG
jgi:hypothetical protein